MKIFRKITPKAALIGAILFFGFTILQGLILSDRLIFYGAQVINIDFILSVLLPLALGVTILIKKPLPALIVLTVYFFHEPLEIINFEIFWFRNMIDHNSSLGNAALLGYPMSDLILSIAVIVSTVFAYAALIILAACNTFKRGEKIRSAVNRFWFVPSIVLAVLPIYSLIAALNTESFYFNASYAVIAGYISDIVLPVALAFYALYFASYRKYDGSNVLSL